MTTVDVPLIGGRLRLEIPAMVPERWDMTFVKPPSLHLDLPGSFTITGLVVDVGDGRQIKFADIRVRSIKIVGDLLPEYDGDNLVCYEVTEPADEPIIVVHK